jgi:FlaA1/EpsC-like NDP-sugar epimerase
MVRELRRVRDVGLLPIGFLDDAPVQPAVEGLPVLGGLPAMARIIRDRDIQLVLIAIPSLGHRAIHRLASAASGAGASVRYLPSFIAALQRDATMQDLRRLDVDQLLGREEVRVIRPSSGRAVRGRRVLVTGAGGSIGAELCRQIDGFEPRALFFLDHDETNLHSLQMALDGRAGLDSDDVIVADIRDADRVRQVFHDVRPQVVFHAAAHKHLPLLERNPCEGVKSNVLGTKHLVDAALATGVERFVLISTDKAADPTSVLGATKRLAELILQSCAAGKTRFASVRFGNVLGSRGSFLSVLSEQISNGEPITITHPDVTRFFMTTEEAVGLVLEAGAMAGAGQTFVLDMGTPVRIVDLVRNYSRQTLHDEEALDIRFTGLRAGEKLNEALFSEQEDAVPTRHPRIWATRPRPLPGDFLARLHDLFAAAWSNDELRCRQLLRGLVPEYRPGAEPERTRTMAAPYPDWF